MVRVIHITDSMLRTSARSRAMRQREETAECVRRVREALVARNLPWYKRAVMKIAAWVEG